jgi:hypothetical protein
MGTPAKRIVIKYGTRKAPAKSNYHHRDVIIATKKGKKSIQSTIIQIHINSRRILRRNQNGTKKSGEKVIDYMEVIRRQTPAIQIPLFMDDPVTCTAFRKYRDTDTGTDTLETYLDS